MTRATRYDTAHLIVPAAVLMLLLALAGAVAHKNTNPAGCIVIYEAGYPGLSLPPQDAAGAR